MTNEEALVLYGDLELKFGSYYKYEFTFSAVAPDGNKVSASIGGNSGDIYRMSITPQSTLKLSENRHFRASVEKGYEALWDWYEP